MKRFGMTSLMISLLLVTGCATSGNQYYEAVQRTAEANALAAEARYKALSEVAQSGDGQAASAAVMAIALTQETRITPQVVEHDALKWARVLMPSFSTLGMAWMQTDLAKTQSNNSKDIQMAMHGHQESIQLGQQNMVLGLSESWSTGGAANADAMLTMGLAGFDALNTAGDQTVSVATTGFNTVDSVVTTGFNTVDSVATTGFTTVGSVATTGMDNLNEMGQFGMTTVGAVGMYGIDATETLGIQGMLGIHETNEDWLNYSTTRDTNISQILADFNATIKQFGTDLGTPLTCNADANGVFTCQ